MKIYHISLIALLAFGAIFSTASSCKKKKKYCESGSTCRSVLEAKEFFLFKEGSWWVYEEETTHERDSQYVYEYTNTSGYDFDLTVFSSRDGYFYHFWPKYANGAIETCSESEPVSKQCLYIYRNKWKIGDYIGEGNVFFINYKVGDWIFVDNYTFPNDKITLSKIYDNLLIPAGNFQRVIEITETATQIENNQQTKHYYVQNIGLIRKELIDSNQVWNLVNYHIEQ